MALPTLQPYWMKSYRNRNEGIMVRREQNEADRRDVWDRNARYFHKSDVETTKQRAWGSKDSYLESMNALDNLYKKNTTNTKKEILESRRKKLSDMLIAEKKSLEQEMRELRLGGAGNLMQMKERADELKADKELRRKEIADQKMYEHWKQNAPELREIEADQLKDYVVGSWADQVTERREKQRMTREEEERVEAAMERDRQLAIKKAREKEKDKRREELEVAAELKSQMEELRRKEEEAQILKREQEILVNEQRKIEEAEEKRRQYEEARKKRELGRVLIRQHKAQLRRKSQQIQEALELDLQILENLARKEEHDKILRTARREKARADAEYMRKVVEEQLKLEREREAELDMLYRDEAARMWSKREAEWERERLARERLMAEVLEGRKLQLDEQMEELRRKQEESIESREELLRELQAVQQTTAREKEEDLRRRREREEEIKGQITARQEIRKEARFREKEDLERQRHEQQAYEAMLRHEAARMKARGPQPRFTPRRRTAFE